MKILVLGASGMLGHMLLRQLVAADEHEVIGAARRTDLTRHFPPRVAARIVPCPDLAEPGALAPWLQRVAPDVIVNCVGVIKQLAQAQDPLVAIPLNALLPHQLARWARQADARLVQLSTDCVFSGARGGYTEQDAPDPVDLYGRSKLLGEPAPPNVITLRTSMVGRELDTRNGLVEWFLSQQGQVRGFTRAIFSGLTTRELSRVIAEVVLPRPGLDGLYHVAGPAISKHDLLQLLANHHGRDIRIVPDATLVQDRSLRADRFQAATGYQAPDWPRMVAQMDALLERNA